MSGSTPSPGRDMDGKRESGRGSRTTAPRWVKLLGIVALVLAVLVVVLLVTGGEHGPRRHTSGDARGRTSTATLIDGRISSGGGLGGRG
jgi:hypothetical protein